MIGAGTQVWEFLRGVVWVAQRYAHTFPPSPTFAESPKGLRNSRGPSHSTPHRNNPILAEIKTHITAETSLEFWQPATASDLQVDGGNALPTPLQGHPGPHSERSHGNCVGEPRCDSDATPHPNPCNVRRLYSNSFQSISIEPKSLNPGHSAVS
ncbi:unnamed protein product [Leptosia nina]|uniref:Uncharacterized protein n=1 Tax=Leptosia nina TaxID=320188 RepID=A0AAV1J716_9NEOP